MQDYVAASNTTAACTTLSDFISEVKAQTNKTISAADAESFTAQASAIEALLSC